MLGLGARPLTRQPPRSVLRRDMEYRLMAERTVPDFIIIGAGSSGCVLANRLSADPSCRVLLVEAGPTDWNPLIRVPLYAGKLFSAPSVSWQLHSEPQVNAHERRSQSQKAPHDLH